MPPNNLNDVLKRLQAMQVVEYTDIVEQAAARVNDALRGTSHKTLGYVLPRRDPYAQTRGGGEKSFGAFRGLDLEEPQELLSLGTSKELEADKPLGFVGELCSLLSAIGYASPKIISVKTQSSSRIPISVVTFKYGSPKVIDQIFIKEYPAGSEQSKLQDMVLPVFFNERGVKAPMIVGYDIRKGELPERLGFFKFEQPCYLRLAEKSYRDLVEEGALDEETLVDDTGGAILSLMARMHIVGRRDREVLKAEYGLALPRTENMDIIRGRLTDFIRVNPGADEKKVDRFLDDYRALERFQSAGH